ncbi:unnamed protein product [Cylicocyclus nassatus]|uniref:Uncharacterized protein n=1 Tax=Cylicocyclus nassatus TaxID=53992 RepID=A0AA36MG07_CYLNA|nr:unnamed protein product [Cylicocyclus nassatus]
MLIFFLLFAATAAVSAEDKLELHRPRHHKGNGSYSPKFVGPNKPEEHHERYGPHPPEFPDTYELEEPHRRYEPYSSNVPELGEHRRPHESQSSLPGFELVLGSQKIIMPAGRSLVIPQWAESPHPLDPITYPTTTLENEDYLGKVTTAHPYTPLPDEERTTATEGGENTKKEATTAAQEETTVTAMTSESEQPHGTEEEEFTPIFEGTTIAPVW